MIERSWPFLIAIAILAGVFLLTPYEAFVEGGIAFVIVVAAVTGFLMPPQRDVFYVRTNVRLVDADGNQFLEHDVLAVRVELVRLWILFLPTALAVAFLVFFAAGGASKFSFLNWVVSLRFSMLLFAICQYPPLAVLVLLSAWVGERRVLRDAAACSARSYSFSRSHQGRITRVSYLFMGEHGEYYGGDCAYFGLIHSRELANIVFHDVSRPEVNKIAMGFLFHRLVVLGRGVTDLDQQTAAAQAALADVTSSS